MIIDTGAVKNYPVANSENNIAQLNSGTNFQFEKPQLRMINGTEWTGDDREDLGLNRNLTVTNAAKLN